MKVIREKRDGQVTIADMPAGSLGMTDDGNYFYRTFEGACCLTEFDQSFSRNANNVKDVTVTLLKPGERVTLEVE